MDVLLTDTGLSIPKWDAAASDCPKNMLNLAVTRALLFRFLLAHTPNRNSQLVDLGAGSCIFAKIARDEGYTVTAVDACTERKPTLEELGSIRFVQSDVRAFDLRGFDVIALLGLLYHFDLSDQLELLRRCARVNMPVILETQIHVEGSVPDNDKLTWLREPVTRGPYRGVMYPENNTAMASIGNSKSFWPTEASLLRMFENAGFRDVTVIEPAFRSKYGARRFFLLNRGQHVVRAERVLDIARHNERQSFVDLVDTGRFLCARGVFERMSPAPTDLNDWAYAKAAAQMHMQFGECEKAAGVATELRQRALGSSAQSCAVLLICVQIFEIAGDAREARVTFASALERLREPGSAERLIRQIISYGKSDGTSRLLAHLEGHFPGDLGWANFIAQAYYSIEEFNAAERVCRVVLQCRPCDVQALSQLGYAEFRLGRFEDSASTLSRALVLDPTNPRILERLTAAEIRLKRLDEAKRHARSLISFSPFDPRGHSYLASVLKQTRRISEALEHANRAAELDPTSVRYRQYARALSRQLFAKRNSARV